MLEPLLLTSLTSYQQPPTPSGLLVLKAFYGRFDAAKVEFSSVFETQSQLQAVVEEEERRGGGEGVEEIAECQGMV